MVEFKSNVKFYEKEKSGVKNNSVRFYDTDPRFTLLDDFESGIIKNLSIKTVNRETGESFIRKITDVSRVKNMYIISWEV